MITRIKTERTQASDHLAAASLLPRTVHDLPARAGVADVSVIVPTYNRRDLVLQTLEALSQQQAARFEVVIVDDASTDGSFAAIAKRAGELGLYGRVVNLQRNRGPADARNVGILAAAADTLAFTDSDCTPTPTWLKAGLAALRPGVRVVVGLTCPPPDGPRPFFSHFMHVERLDGTYSTCNAFYPKGIVVEAGGFDPARVYCEDLDLGWRVLSGRGVAAYARDAVVYHQVIKQTPMEWLRWPGRLATWPACIARHPEGRSYLFARYWVNSSHAALTLAIAGVVMAPVFPPALALIIPYALGFVDRFKFGGRWPLVKAGLHLWWDIWGWLSLARSSIKNRTLVL